MKDVGLLWLRLMMGAGIAWHGYGKLFGGQMDMFTNGVSSMGFPFPVFFAWAAALTEFVGGILIAIGLKVRIAAAFVAVTMIVAAFVAHKLDPFKVKELALAYLTIAVALGLTGPGRYSLDRS